ncbi:MAG: tetratricopeptide repeat protein [Rikenellaceae bacterium]|jgi:tetratricopeptide (TPR) repeat protein|nr:tetratricopeptide repeat protein [Rikenellaceae bacterium]
MSRLIIIAVAMLMALPAMAQKYPERSMIRSGNRQYEKEKYVESEISYRRALEKTPASYEAADNLAKSLYKQQRWDEAAGMFAPLAADSLHRQHAPEAYYDQGNALFRQRKFAEAIEAYKQSLRLNPADQQAKFNLAYAQKMQQEQQDGGGGNDNQDQNQNQDQQGGGQPDPQPAEANPQPAQPKEGALSKEEAERMLEAVQMGEDKTREKMEEKKGKPGKSPGGKNW